METDDTQHGNMLGKVPHSVYVDQGTDVKNKHHVALTYKYICKQITLYLSTLYGACNVFKHN